MNLTKTSSYRLKVKIATQISEFHKKGFVGFMAFKNVVQSYISDFPESLLKNYYDQKMHNPQMYEIIEDVMFRLSSESILKDSYKNIEFLQYKISRMYDLVRFEGFMKTFLENLIACDNVNDSYELTEEEYQYLFGERRFKDFDAFLQANLKFNIKLQDEWLRQYR